MEHEFLKATNWDEVVGWIKIREVDGYSIVSIVFHDSHWFVIVARKKG